MCIRKTKCSPIKHWCWSSIYFMISGVEADTVVKMLKAHILRKLTKYLPIPKQAASLAEFGSSCLVCLRCVWLHLKLLLRCDVMQFVFLDCTKRESMFKEAPLFQLRTEIIIVNALDALENSTTSWKTQTSDIWSSYKVAFPFGFSQINMFFKKFVLFCDAVGTCDIWFIVQSEPLIQVCILQVAASWQYMYVYVRI